MLPLPILSTLAQGVVGFFTKKQDIKKTAEIAKAKLLHAKESNNQEISLTDAEWESLSVKTQDETWKDEYITVVITSPIVTLMVGNIMAAFGMPEGVAVVEGTKEAIKDLIVLGMDYGFLIGAVTMAAVGLKVWRGK